MTTKVLIIGLGSAGRRHLKVLQALIDPAVIHYGHKEADSSFADLEPCLEEKPDFAIIANPTHFHVPAALRLAEKQVPFLLEKPVSDTKNQLDELKSTVDKKGIPVMVGFQLRHHPGYRKLREIVQSGIIGEPLSLTGYVGHDLSKWRPGSDYRLCYSAQKKLGGGVILDLCHEIDIAVSLMGPATQVACMAGRVSNLEIDTEDAANIVLSHGNGKRMSFIHLNYLEQTYEWSTRVTGSLGSAVWDYGRGFLEVTNSRGLVERWSNPATDERDELFSEQMKQWLHVLKGKGRPEVTLHEGIYVTEVALAAKQASEENRTISL